MAVPSVPWRKPRGQFTSWTTHDRSRGGEQVRDKRERKSWPICAPRSSIAFCPENFRGKAFSVEKEKIPVFFFNRFEIRYVLLVGRSVERFEMRQIAAWMGFLGRGWKTNRKGRALMECHGLGVWILIRCEQGNWAEGNFESRVRSRFFFSFFFFYYVISMIRGMLNKLELFFNWNPSSCKSVVPSMI